MHPFVETISIAGAVAAVVVSSIMVLTLFYRGLAWAAGADAGPATMGVRGVLTPDTWVSIHISGGENFERVRFVGFLNTEAVKGHFPFELNGMMILEDPQGTRFLVRAKNVKMFVIPPDGQRARQSEIE